MKEGMREGTRKGTREGMSEGVYFCKEGCTKDTSEV